MLAEFQITLPAQTTATADPKGKTLLENTQATLGFIPNMYANMVNSPGSIGRGGSTNSTTQNSSSTKPGAPAAGVRNVESRSRRRTPRSCSVVCIVGTLSCE